jgi:3-hydroxyacyl-CoA dehydrogenase
MAKDANKARIAVIGAGLMGHGIAQVFASAGPQAALRAKVTQHLKSMQSL